MGYMNHNLWYERLTSNATERAASQKSGVTTSTLNRQLAKGVLSPENVIALSRAYGVSPIQGLVSTGYLEANEVSNMSEEELADSLSDRIIIKSFAKRISEDYESWFADGELSTKENAQTSNVRSIQQRSERSGAPDVADEEYDEDALIDGINAGTEPFAAQEATDPLDETWS